mgnify:FL=1
MQYDEIYFASLADVSTVEDDTIRQADQVLVYVSRMEQTEERCRPLQMEWAVM